MQHDNKKQAIGFNTLAYSQSLKQDGVEHSEVHSRCLAEALGQNIYVKAEVDSMIEAALRRSDELQAKLQAEIANLRTDMVKMNSRNIITIVGILGALMVVISAVSNFGHYTLYKSASTQTVSSAHVKAK